MPHLDCATLACDRHFVDLVPIRDKDIWVDDDVALSVARHGVPLPVEVLYRALAARRKHVPDVAHRLRRQTVQAVGHEGQFLVGPQLRLAVYLAEDCHTWDFMNSQRDQAHHQAAVQVSGVLRG